MTQENYLLTDSELRIEDQELGISLCLAGQFLRLPNALTQAEEIVIEKNESGNIICAYLAHEGKKQGQCRLFYPDGTLKAEMFYDQGVLHGPSLFFSNKMQKLTETWYVHGKKMGKVKFFYLSGNLASLQRFKEGVCEGLQEYWYEEGTVKSLIPYVHGAIHGQVSLFWESGQRKRCATYVNGHREGWDRIWNEKGVLIDEGEFLKGQPKGAHRQFFADGKIKEELYYHTSFRFDRKEWDSAGEVVREGKYAPDLSYTEHAFLQPSGTEMRKGYWDGQRLCWK